VKKNPKKRSEEKRIEDNLKILYHSLHAHTGFPNSRFRKKAEALLQSGRVRDLLQKEGYIEEDKRGWKLTDKGLRKALEVIRRHRIIEKYLAEKTGIDPFMWHDLAEKREHDLSDEEVAKLEKLLGYPLFDPHGDPIPTTTGQWVEQKAFPLAEAEEGMAVKILHLEDEPRDMGKVWAKWGLYHGAVMRILKKTKRYISVLSQGETLNIPKEFWYEIYLKETKDEWKDNLIRLSRLKKNEKGKVVKLSGNLRGLLRQRLMDLGFVRGAVVQVYMYAPLGEPVAYDIKGSTVALRKEEADKILIEKI